MADIKTVMLHLFRSKSYLAIASLFVFILVYFALNKTWSSNRITVDAPSYYTYLPAFIIHGDPDLKFIDQDRSYYRDKIWFYTLPDGKRLIKHPPGISVMLSPFFSAAHLIAKASDSDTRGYSLLYQNFCTAGVLFYFFLGLFFLRRILIRFFSDASAAVTLLVIVLATNLLWYASAEALMPHAISFSLVSASVWYFLRWLDADQRRFLLVFALLFGLTVLVRPLALSLSVFFLCFAIIHDGGVSCFFDRLKKQVPSLLWAVLVFGLIISPQLLYWRHISGKWILDVYMDEHFVFGSPQFFPFLFSFRKGLFVYSPVLLLMVPGLFVLYKRSATWFWSVLLIFCASVLLLSSWWAWSYGISWGMRPMIDYYPFLCIAICAIIDRFLTTGAWIKILLVTAVSLCTVLNLFQTWQYSKGLIHYDDMTRAAYFKGFLQTSERRGWRDLLEPYDWDRRIRGLPQPDYSRSFFESLPDGAVIRIRGYNGYYAGVNPRAGNALGAYLELPDQTCDYRIRKLPGNKYCFIGFNERLLAVQVQQQLVIAATATIPRITEIFEIEFVEEGANRIALKAGNNRYITISQGFPYVLAATAAERGDNETFRYFAPAP
jgi:hypothetical protein